ncbi:hypothetical protein SAMN05518845_1088 [Variovorax sp. YR750]|uniref:Uncharacterized protein n=1 Tax=Variovorax gossypii TaxID=1679495 RepID=A0A431TSV2_9BURK|nr:MULTISPECIES: hypothetical protein [Variovorax]SEF29815.1 hypothetical protein SAMN03159371_04391 [Variovorax sp. NFACC28]SEG85933.1 hypothetical protein SAMN03159365_04701 [Variovorax sp. NFACC29]SFG29168.1 hypothetical protein SAMN03159447_02700 [Variovorax sp. NFACC27]RTQ37086.1 hypothetical protein EJP69_04980 [Variovorax gossypii]SEL50616.1 hypothetical protein SAMN05518845_1088 [Variovorax sp. YR750]
MLMVTKVAAVSLTAIVMGGTPSPGSDPAGLSLVTSPVAAVQPSPGLPSQPCVNGCNVWRMIHERR